MDCIYYSCDYIYWELNKSEERRENCERELTEVKEKLKKYEEIMKSKNINFDEAMTIIPDQ